MKNVTHSTKFLNQFRSTIQEQEIGKRKYLTADVSCIQN